MRRAGLLLLALVLLALGTLATPDGARAETPPAGLGGFAPGNLISDSAMFDGDAMSAAQVQTFLDQKGSACRTDGVNGALCLRVYRTDTPARAATEYCAAIPARAGATAARVIADVSLACDVSPRVLLVMLQKEQGLVTTTAPTQKKLDEALGFACPDFLGCDTAKAGFAQQIYLAGSRLQEYGDPDLGFRYRSGRTYDIQYSPYTFCGYGKVTLANRATAALYNYTPFTPTQATLDAGSGAVADDVCATYGNRNFFRLYSQWFGTPNGRSATHYPVAAPAGKAPANPFTDVTPTSSIFFVEISWMKHEGYTTGWSDGTYRPLQPINRDAMAAFLYRAAGSPAYTPPARSPFRDVSTTSMYYTEIAWAWSEGITTGWDDGTFRPLEPINRDAMAAFLYRYAGEPAFTAPRTSPFEDVSRSTSIFYDEITWAAATGISTGWSDGTYRPLQSINRDAMAAFIYRFEVV
ncbi:S-layer homology domain-containing protein [Brachybacterium sp. J153]|uniref:S-layer homology domain-containing protein n=1 Tax=Brachybacterium sp. J153 TaxID=3116488 RepID=UPI002E7A2895|nr:S-layer homology domain-containing protein [Brachybacterium sp. J153]MEE1618896.1 S-layer homology domain-containing protein [Brachybacterium sp. J153]